MYPNASNKMQSNKIFFFLFPWIILTNNKMQLITNDCEILFNCNTLLLITNKHYIRAEVVFIVVLINLIVGLLLLFSPIIFLIIIKFKVWSFPPYFMSLYPLQHDIGYSHLHYILHCPIYRNFTEATRAYFRSQLCIEWFSNNFQNFHLAFTWCSCLDLRR